MHHDTIPPEAHEDSMPEMPSEAPAPEPPRKLARETVLELQLAQAAVREAQLTLELAIRTVERDAGIPNLGDVHIEVDGTVVPRAS